MLYFFSLIFSFQNHREYYKNCTIRQPGDHHASLSVSGNRSVPIFMPYFRRRRNLVRFPVWTFWQPPPEYSSQPGYKQKAPRLAGVAGLCYIDSVVIDYLFRAVATSTAQATVQPTMGLLL